MQERTLGRTGVSVGVVGLGAWQLGADRGEVNEDEALATLIAAHDAGVTFIPGARNGEQARANAAVGDLAPLPPATHEEVKDVYDELIRASVHSRW